MLMSELKFIDSAIEVGSLYNHWRSLSFEERRQIIEHAVERIARRQGRRSEAESPLPHPRRIPPAAILDTMAL